MCSKLEHGVFFAVNKERTFRSGLRLPSKQLCLVGMRRKTVDGVDASPNRYILSQNVHLLGAVDDTTRCSPGGCVGDKHDARIVATKILLEMVEDATPGSHARTGHDYGPSTEAVYRHRIGGLSREMQTWQSKRVLSLFKQLRRRWLKALRMASENIRC